MHSIETGQNNTRLLLRPYKLYRNFHLFSEHFRMLQVKYNNTMFLLKRIVMILFFTLVISVITVT